MPAGTVCPIPGVNQALSSYINSRDDTLKIRRTISRYLTASLRPVNHATQNQHANHECPQSISAANTNPPGLKDSRIAYLRFLRAKSQAEARHLELQALLNDVQNRHVDENPTLSPSEHNTDSTNDYINLLRQRRKLAELNIVQDSLEKLLSAKPTIHSYNPRDHVQEAIGEQPDLPAERLVQIAQPQDDQSSTFKLKQEVLEARARMDRAEITRKQAHDVARNQFKLHEQVRALERARDEIVEWIQGELAKMEEDSVFLEDASPVKLSVKEHAALDLPSAEARIRASYDQYTSARVQLIGCYHSLNEPQPEDSKDKSHATTKDLSGSFNGTELHMPVTKLLPHLALLARFTQNERSLLQHAVFFQNQLAIADQELSEALLRLSGESHLLPAGAKDASAWGRIATEAESATDKSVKEYLQAGRQEIDIISTIVDLCSLQSKVLAAV
ncbi:hypothetical protein N0V95_001018 [Ascochyta clinopodiicola]|nr:hypothetical protein N0V95_001018 [Ascochyta clinopodiicola]